MKIRQLAAILAIVGATASMWAQNGTMTPYSRFGYGILGDNATAAQTSMGGVGYAMNSGRQINVMNPASYAYADSLTFLFDMGIDVTNLWSSEVVDGTKTSESQFGGGLSYVTMQFPLSKRLGMSIGILPFTSVGYAFGNDITNGYAERQGSGNLNQLYVGLGGKIVSGLTAGVNVAYLYGTLMNDTYALTTSGSTGLYKHEMRVRDFRINVGLQYGLELGRDRLTLGLVYTPGKELLGRSRSYFYDVSADESTTPADDDNTKLKDLYSLAPSYGVGLSYMWRNRLLIEADATYQPWASCKYAGATHQLADRYKAAVGVQYQPALRGSYLQRTQYRAGVYYDRDYLMVRGNNVREYGATVGFGFPVPGFKTVVSLGVGWMHRQAYPTALIKEDYLQVTLGVNFNEMWFRKSKIY